MASRESTPKPDSKIVEPKTEEPKKDTKTDVKEEPKKEPESAKEQPKKEPESKVAAKEQPKKEESKDSKPAPDSPKVAAKGSEASKPEAKEANGKEEAKNGAEKPEENGERPSTPKGPTLREQFRAFSKFGDTKSDGKVLTLSQSDKWMKQAKVIEPKSITTTDTAIAFKKFKQMKIGYPDYEKYLADLSKSRSIDIAVIKDKMRNCGTPGTRGTTSVVKGGAFERLTDSQKYTGSHRARFDPEGKGKGIAGRKDLPDKSGYVAGYKNKDTYSKTH